MAMSILSAFALCTAVAMAFKCPEDSKPPGGASQQAPSMPPPTNGYDWKQYVPSMPPPANNSYNWNQYVPSAAGPGSGSSGSSMNFSKYIPAGVGKYIPAQNQDTMALANCYAWANGPEKANSTRELCAWHAGMILSSSAYTPKDYAGGYRFAMDNRVQAGVERLHNISNGKITLANCSGTIFKFHAHPAKANAADCTSKSELDAWYKQQVAMTKKLVPPVALQYAVARDKAEYDKNLLRIRAPPTFAPTTRGTTIAPPPPPAALNMVQASLKKTPLAIAAASVGSPDMVQASLKKTPLASAAASVGSPDAVNEIQFFAIVGVVAIAVMAAAGLWLRVRSDRFSVDPEVVEYNEMP